MSYKIAVASSDGKVVNQHFGKATQFLIFEMEENTFKFLELLKTTPFCSNAEHEDDKLSGAVEVLVGCRAVVVSQIGSGAAEALRNKGIEPLDVHNFIEDALKKILKYYAKIDKNIN